MKDKPYTDVLLGKLLDIVLRENRRQTRRRYTFQVVRNQWVNICFYEQESGAAVDVLRDVRINEAALYAALAKLRAVTAEDNEEVLENA